MSDPIVISDEEDENTTPTPIFSKRSRTEPDPYHTVLLSDTEPTPHKASGSLSTPSYVSDTPFSDDACIRRCTIDPQTRVLGSNLYDKFSDKEDHDSPVPSVLKRPKTGQDSCPTILVLDSDPTPQKPSFATAPLFVDDNPIWDNVSNVKCSDGPQFCDSNQARDEKFSGKHVITLESDDESESGFKKEDQENSRAVLSEFDAEKKSECKSNLAEPAPSSGNAIPFGTYESNSLQAKYSPDDNQFGTSQDKENFSMAQMCNSPKQQRVTKATVAPKAVGNSRMTKEEKIRVMEEKKLKKEQEKLQKAALKAEAAEHKRIEKEKQKWENGKLALKSIVAEVDAKVVQLGSIGGQLLSRFSDKGVTFRVTSNPLERSIVWNMTIPEDISELFPQGIVIPYVVLVYEADEFCNLIASGNFPEHVSRVQSQYPSYTICYLTNKLMAYINKREKEQYKNPANNNGWRRPPVEETLAKLTTHYVRVHSRHCVDEAELAEHVAGLTCSLASCQFRKKLTRLSVNANGSLIPKDSVDRHLIKQSLWLKALVAIPKVQPRFGIAISKKYPTMKSLLSVYMDSNKSVHEKEFLLKDLMTEGLLGGDRRLGEICSKRIYRILMAQNGNVRTDDIEDGADFFSN